MMKKNLVLSYGKSLIYTLLPPIMDRYHDEQPGHTIVVVISPLTVLMEEQVAKINSLGVSAVYLGAQDLSSGIYISL